MSFTSSKKGEGGFTTVEVVIASILGLILLAGMVALLAGSFGVFHASRDLQALTDEARRSMATMARQVRGAVFLVDDACSSTQMTFYAEVEGGESYVPETRRDYENIDQNMTKIILRHGAGGTAEESIVPKGGQSAPFHALATNVESLSFTYYDAADREYSGPDYNEDVNRVRITMRLRKGKITRTFSQDVFIRVTSRTYY